MFKEIWFPLLSGLALFLFGMKTMELALHAWAGPYLQRFLHRSTRTPIHGMLFSTGMTAVLQSSTAITVITIGLVNAGIMNFSRTLGIILGTNIGTCLTTELIGLNISQFAKPLLFLSLAEWMKQISEPLQQRGLFTWFLERSSDSLLWALAAGVVITALVHSSAAIIAMAMGLSATGALPVEVGIAIAIGSNVGTCFTAVIASLGGTRSGQFVAWTHVVLNIGGAVLFYPFISQIGQLSAVFGSDAAGQIAHAQTIFNIASSLLALPLCYLPVWNQIR